MDPPAEKESLMHSKIRFICLLSLERQQARGLFYQDIEHWPFPSTQAAASFCPLEGTGVASDLESGATPLS